MPTSRRIASIFLRSEVSSMPATVMRPCWCSSSRLMQRIIVDLPEPDGPQTTTRSPLPTSRLMSVSTWNSPNHLCIWRISIMPPLVRPAPFSAMPAPVASLALWAAVELALQHLAVTRHEKTEAEVDRGGEHVGFSGEALPGGVRQCGVDGAEQVE